MGKFTKPWEDLEITDDYMFCKTMSNETICKSFLETLLDIKIEKIEYIQTEKELVPNYQSRGIRLDVYVKDSNRIFDLEMQTTNKKDLELRSRYYQGLMDIDFLTKNQDYKSLKESFIIFICTFDPFGEKLPIYTVKQHFAEKSEIEFSDKTHKIFYNVKEFKKIQNNIEVKGLLSYLCNKKPTTTLTNSMENAVILNKTNKNWRAEYMFLSVAIRDEIDEGIAQGIEQGIKQGIQQGIKQGIEQGIQQGMQQGIEQGSYNAKISTARNMLAKNFDCNLISEITGLSIEEINQLK